MLDIDAHLEYRFGSCLSKKVVVTKDELFFNESLKTMAAFSTIRPCFFSLNNYSQIIGYDKNEFQRLDTQSRLGRRQVMFANLANQWGIKSIFLTNWCDAQGWDYSAKLQRKIEIPVFQFSRKNKQRNSVILFPLNREFMGYGGKNIPTIKDEKEFVRKKDNIVWRGRYSGTLSDDVSYIFWAESLVQKEFINVKEEARKKYLAIPRYEFIRQVFLLDFVDVGFVHTGKELENIHNSPWKNQILSPFLKARMSIEQQKESKFIFALPGNDYASNLYWALMANSVVFVLETEWETALDAGLEPWVHYVPVSLDKIDVINKYNKMLADIPYCLEIIKNAHEYMNDIMNHDLRDALDYETLKMYQDRVIPIADLDHEYSFSRGSK